MGKMIVRTAEEIDRDWPPERIRALAESGTVPSFPDETTAEDMATGRVIPMGRGFASYREYINRGGRPKVADKKVTVGIRLPETVAADMRTVRGYSSILSEYILAGISSGQLKFSTR